MAKTKSTTTTSVKLNKPRKKRPGVHQKSKLSKLNHSKIKTHRKHLAAPSLKELEIKYNDYINK